MKTPTNLIVETLPFGHLRCNYAILGDLLSGKEIILDPGGVAELLINRLLD